MADSATILLVEDNPDDAALTELALRASWPAHLEIVRDAGEAVDYLFGNAHDAPQLVLLDLGLPDTRRSGGAAAHPTGRAHAAHPGGGPDEFDGAR